MKKYLSSITVSGGLVQALTFSAMTADDLPASGVVPGTYSNATVQVDATGRVVSASSGPAPGTVTSVSVVNANGISGSVATPTTTPALTLALGAITPTSVAASGAVTGSNLSGTNTGDQFPRVRAAADLTGQTAAATVCTYTDSGAGGTYRAGGYVAITAVSVDVLQLQVLWTDETNAARTLILVPVGGATLSTTGVYAFPDVQIRVKASTVITVQVSLTVGGGSVAYDVGGTVEQLR